MDRHQLAREHAGHRRPFFFAAVREDLLQLIHQRKRIISLPVTVQNLHGSELRLRAVGTSLGDHETVAIPLDEFICHVS